ncbi:MAG: transcriptional regulator [Candidatus Eisenbacteria sp.]|nr:transcriptional regulator [Candidatus Eisenbacteria bacterium]
MDFDEHLLSPARLAIITSLVPGEALSFTHLKRVAALADGNLHVQTRKLEDVGYIEIIKGQRGRRSWTRFRITEKGLAALRLHIRKLQGILATESGVIRPTPHHGKKDASQVWSR